MDVSIIGMDVAIMTSDSCHYSGSKHESSGTPHQATYEDNDNNADATNTENGTSEEETAEELDDFFASLV
jgi:hypothetical protein